jgi:uncharacterized protein YraI
MRIILAIAGLFLTGAAHGQEAVEPAATDVFEVIGIAENDLLNLRATASPSGMLVARVPNGTLLRSHGCVEVGENRWCKVSEIDTPTIMGWAAERYLQLPVATEPAPE